MQNVGFARSGFSELSRHLTATRCINGASSARIASRLGRPEEDEGDELAAGNLQVEEPPQLLHQLTLLEHVRLIDQYHRLPTRFVQLHQPLVDLGQEGDLFLRRLPDADLRPRSAGAATRREMAE